MYISSMFLSVMKLCNFRNRNAYLSSGSIQWTNAGVGTNTGVGMNTGAGGMNPVKMQVLELYCFCVPLIFWLSFWRHVLEPVAGSRVGLGGFKPTHFQKKHP